MRCVFANATFTGGRATARSHENRSRGGVLSCRVRWHMKGGMRVPYHARAPQQHEERSRFGHWVVAPITMAATPATCAGGDSGSVSALPTRTTTAEVSAGHRFPRSL